MIMEPGKPPAGDWQEDATPLSGRLRRSTVARMILSVMTYRTPAQMAVTVAKAWTVGGGTRELVRELWDPRGPMTAEEAIRRSCHIVLWKLSQADAGDADDPAERPWADVPLPFDEL